LTGNSRPSALSGSTTGSEKLKQTRLPSRGAISSSRFANFARFSTAKAASDKISLKIEQYEAAEPWRIVTRDFVIEIETP
jgi:hypothetical protein